MNARKRNVNMSEGGSATNKKKRKKENDDIGLFIY
jgi:hypothetical protein